MDLVSIETQEENNLIFRLIQQSECLFLIILSAIQATITFIVIIIIISAIREMTLQLYNS